MFRETLIAVTMAISNQGEIVELIEPGGPEFTVHSLEGRCGADVYKITYLMGTSLHKNYIADISGNGTSVHVRELVKLNPVLQNRSDLQSIRFGHCNPNAKPGIEFFVVTPRDKTLTPFLDSHRFILAGNQITRVRGR